MNLLVFYQIYQLLSLVLSFQEAKAKLKLLVAKQLESFFDCINNTLARIWQYSPTSALAIFSQASDFVQES